MSTFVESLKRLYAKEKVSKDQLDQLLMESKINQEEYDYVIGGEAA